jgi:ankyrin repeat protein
LIPLLSRETYLQIVSNRFQWVKCQLDTLCTLITDKSIRASLKQLPKGLDETYVRAFSKIRKEMGVDAVMIKRIFHWLVHSKRPLTLRELSEAISIEFQQRQLDFSAIPTDPEDIFRFCGGLVSISGRDNEETLNLSHFSIKEFLLSPRIKETEVSEFYAGSSGVMFDIASTCLTYIMLDDFREGQCMNGTKMRERKSKYAFLAYAALYWSDHYKAVDSEADETLEELVFALFTDPDHSGSVESWFQASKEAKNSHWDEIYTKYSDYKGTPILVPNCTAMYHAARLGLSRIVKRLIANGHDMNAKAQTEFGEYDYPIIVAASEKHWATVDLLIDAGASLHVFSREGSFLTGLAQGCGPEIWWLFKKVLDRGGSQLLQESATWRSYTDEISVLEALALHPLDAWEMVELFIRNGADANDWLDYELMENLMKGKELAQYGSPPLQRAAFQGNNRVLEVLVKAGAWINFSCCELGSPLQAATRGNRESSILRLLELDADINVKGGALGTPLQAAAWNGNVRIMTLLLNHGADVNVEGGLYGCALNAAIQQKHKDAVEVLLLNGADINQFCAFKNAIWDSASDREVSYGLLSNRRFCETPLNNAILAGDVSNVTSLLRAGARLLQDDERCTFKRLGLTIPKTATIGTHSLCLATIMEDIDMVNILLRSGANLKAGNYCALVRAASKYNFPILKLLFDRAGEDLNNMSSALPDIITHIEDEALARDLIPILERVFIKDNSESQRYLLSITVSNGCLSLTEFLLKCGFTPNVSRPYRGGKSLSVFRGTPLSLAICRRRMDLFDLLLDYGVDVNLADGTPIYNWNYDVYDRFISGSPLFAAVKLCNAQAVHRLLELGAFPNENTCSLETCPNVVHIAAAHQDPSILEDLLKYGADQTANCYTCPSALMTAVKSQSLDAISILIRAGAKVNEPDLFGRTPLARAKDGGLALAIKRLLEHQAQESVPLEKLCSCLENTVETLTLKLLQRPDPWLEDETYRHFPWRHWISLGRCLILGKDSQNGIIALEQALRQALRQDAVEKFPNWPTHLLCCFCSRSLWGQKFQLCEDCDGVAICEDCIEKHPIMFRNSTYSHKVTEFPRRLLWDVPKGQVALDENTYLPFRVWLEGLRGWTAKL